MHWRELIPSVDVPRLNALQLWVLVGLSFGLGDVVTTIVGLRLAGVYELQLIAASLFQYSVLGAMLVLKSIVFGSCFVLWTWTPRPHRFGVPLGLITLGVLVTTWNLHILLRAILP